MKEFNKELETYKISRIRVPKEIDFKLNQKKINANERANKLKKEINKREKLERRLIYVAIAITMFMSVLILIKLFKGSDTQYDICVDKGYSKEYCINHTY